MRVGRRGARHGRIWQVGTGLALVAGAVAVSQTPACSPDRCVAAADAIAAKASECGIDVGTSDSGDSDVECCDALAEAVECVAACVEKASCAALTGEDVVAGGDYVACIGNCPAGTCGGATSTSSSSSSSSCSSGTTSSTSSGMSTFGYCTTRCNPGDDCPAGPEDTCIDGKCVNTCSTTGCDPSRVCVQVAGHDSCKLACATDGDCAFGTCSGVADDASKFCTDACSTGADCDAYYGTVCEGSLCGCSADADCSDGAANYACVL